MVYVLAADKSFRYRSGRRSRIVYIGTTGGGAQRPATSAADKASQAFAELHGVRRLHVHIATCPGRRRVRTWEELESALLAVFKEMHFELPRFNKKRGSVKYTENIKLFRTRTLKKLILQFAV